MLFVQMCRYFASKLMEIDMLFYCINILFLFNSCLSYLNNFTVTLVADFHVLYV